MLFLENLVISQENEFLPPHLFSMCRHHLPKDDLIVFITIKSK